MSLKFTKILLSFILLAVTASCTAAVNVTPTPAAAGRNVTRTFGQGQGRLGTPTGTSTPAPTDAPTLAPTATTTLTPTATDTPTPSTPCNAAAYAGSLSVPDGTSFIPDRDFVKTWRFQNTGACTWTTGYAVVFISGDQMSAPVAVNLPNAVQPGQFVTVSVPMFAPATAGTYTGYWMLRSDSNIYFGFGLLHGMGFAGVLSQLGLPRREYTLETPMIITHTHGQTVALIVDEVLDVLELPESCMQEAPPLHALASKMIGVCRMPDGLMNLLDIDLLLAIDQFRGGR